MYCVYRYYSYLSTGALGILFFMFNGVLHFTFMFFDIRFRSDINLSI